MKIEDAREHIENYIKQGGIICDITKTSAKNKKSLSGNNFYGDRFHEAIVLLSLIEKHLIKILTTIGEDGEMERFTALSDTIKSPTTRAAVKSSALRDISLAWRSEWLHRLDGMTADPIPATEQVLPMAVVEDTRRGYLIKVVLQANGSYEHQWYDACAVMIRRLVETLIIHVYEAHGREAEIKDGNDNYRMLGHLVDKIANDMSWNLGRETKEVLPLLKSLGDRSAHNRTYNAKKPDIDKVLPGLRVLTDEFLHLAKLK
jgi:hypothetical protein